MGELGAPATQPTMLYQKSGMKGGPSTERERQITIARLRATIPCDSAFRVIAHRYLAEIVASREAACSGNVDAVHDMRIALTRLRSAILFFRPMVDDIEQTGIRHELKWLHSQLGAVRDLDVAIERVKTDKQQGLHTSAYRATLRQKRKEEHRRLTRALRSARYSRLMRSIAAWIENGPWSTQTGKVAIEQRAAPIADYVAIKLARWQRKLLKMSRKLLEMGNRKRHRLRLLNKKLTYSIEAFENLLSDDRFLEYQARVKYLRRAQKCLGQLNDRAEGSALATRLRAEGIRIPPHLISPKPEARLLRGAASAYRKLANISH